MSEVPDHVAALIAFLRADADIASLVGTRIVGGELPERAKVPSGHWVHSMPTKAIVVVGAGGRDPGGYLPLGDPRVDVLAFGETPKAANDVWRRVHPALKNLRRVVFADCLLHFARGAGGPLPLRDPDTDDPFVLSSWQVRVAEVAVA